MKSKIDTLADGLFIISVVILFWSIVTEVVETKRRIETLELQVKELKQNNAPKN